MTMRCWNGWLSSIWLTAKNRPKRNQDQSRNSPQQLLHFPREKRTLRRIGLERRLVAISKNCLNAARHLKPFTSNLSSEEHCTILRSGSPFLELSFSETISAQLGQ